MTETVLSPRLMKIAELVPQGSRIADIGTDHAHLPIYLTQMNKIAFAAACDINKGPLAYAKENIYASGLENIISLRLGGGFDKIGDNEVDTGIIAGMGGELIAEILKTVPKGITRLLLQPMTKLPECRKGIHKAGFIIEKEYLVREKDKIYVIISAVKSDEKQIWSEKEYEFSPMTEDSELKTEYFERKIKKFKVLAEKLKSTGKEDLARKIEEIYSKI